MLQGPKRQSYTLTRAVKKNCRYPRVPEFCRVYTGIFPLLWSTLLWNEGSPHLSGSPSRAGCGLRFLEDGSTYHGEWSGNEMQGTGVLTFVGGRSCYKGNFVASVRQGFGVMHEEDGTFACTDWEGIHVRTLVLSVFTV